jgi:hypothetical protein
MDLDELERLAKAAEVTAPSPWISDGRRVKSPSAPGWLWRVADVHLGGRSSLEFFTLADYFAAVSPAVVLKLIAATRAAQAAPGTTPHA